MVFLSLVFRWHVNIYFNKIFLETYFYHDPFVFHFPGPLDGFF